MRAGPLAAAAAWAGFTLPSAILMTAFAFGAAKMSGPLAQGDPRVEARGGRRRRPGRPWDGPHPPAGPSPRRHRRGRRRHRGVGRGERRSGRRLVMGALAGLIACRDGAQSSPLRLPRLPSAAMRRWWIPLGQPGKVPHRLLRRAGHARASVHLRRLSRSFDRRPPAVSPGPRSGRPQRRVAGDFRTARIAVCVAAEYPERLALIQFGRLSAGG